MMSTRVWHSGMLNDPWSMSLNRSGSGSSFFEYCTSACIFSSRPIERNNLRTRSMDGGMPELVGALSMSSNLIMFRETNHQRKGEPNANEESDRYMGRRTQDWKRKLQRREWSDRRAVQFQLTLRERGGIESRRASRRGRGGLLQYGAERRARGKWNPRHEDRNDGSVHYSGGSRRLRHYHHEAQRAGQSAKHRQDEVRSDRATDQGRMPGLESIEGQRRSSARGEAALERRAHHWPGRPTRKRGRLSYRE